MDPVVFLQRSGLGKTMLADRTKKLIDSYLGYLDKNNLPFKFSLYFVRALMTIQFLF